MARAVTGVLMALLCWACTNDGDSPPTNPGDAGATVWTMPPHCSNGPLMEPIAGCAPIPVPDTGDPYADCVARINQFRAECQCLPPLARWTQGEGCADQHAELDSTAPMPHAAFRARICENSGNAQNECPGWRSQEQVIGGCLQRMWDEGPGEDFRRTVTTSI